MTAISSRRDLPNSQQADAVACLPRQHQLICGSGLFAADERGKTLIKAELGSPTQPQERICGYPRNSAAESTAALYWT
jgi:hypothetical protein